MIEGRVFHYPQCFLFEYKIRAALWSHYISKNTFWFLLIYFLLSPPHNLPPTICSPCHGFHVVTEHFLNIIVKILNKTQLAVIMKSHLRSFTPIILLGSEKLLLFFPSDGNVCWEGRRGIKIIIRQIKMFWLIDSFTALHNLPMQINA